MSYKWDLNDKLNWQINMVKILLKYNTNDIVLHANSKIKILF